MAILETGIYTYLAASTPIAALVSDRIFPNAIPQSESFPCITYNRIGSEQPHHLLAAAVLQSAHIQVDCWDKSSGGYASVSAIADAIKNRIDGYRGAMGSVTVKTCHLSEQRDDYEAPTDGSGIGIHRVSQDYLLWYSITTPSFD